MPPNGRWALILLIAKEKILMNNLDIIFNIVHIGIEILLIVLVVFIYKGVKEIITEGSVKHLAHKKNREKFNKQGVEILNGAIPNDTVYTILRSGTLGADFSNAFDRFHMLTNTKLVVIVPNEEVFLSNFDQRLKVCITEIYENPTCQNVRALLLEPGNQKEDHRMAGYFFISDGHNHQDDDGFYTVSTYSKKFLLYFLKSLINTGKKVIVSE
jgi:hypothetical protein